jgi:hypothetical protein
MPPPTLLTHHYMPRDMSSTKHVRFAVSQAYHSAPSTPSPAFSDLSLPETEGPITPPMFMAPLPTIPEHEPQSSTMRVHGAVVYTPGAVPYLTWDVSYPPNTAIPTNRIAQPAHFCAALGEAVTNPSLSEMILVSDFLPYRVSILPGVGNGSTSSPWTPANVALPMPGSPLPPVTQTVCVYDVLVGLYKNLRTPLTPQEYAALSPTRKAALSSAYHIRVNRIEDPIKREEERRKGLKRIDYLLAAGKTRFIGLGMTKKSNNLWIMNFA